MSSATHTGTGGGCSPSWTRSPTNSTTPATRSSRQKGSKRHGVQQARAQALREAADLVRAGTTVEELDRRAAEAEPVSHTIEELAAEFGIAPEHEPEGDA